MADDFFENETIARQSVTDTYKNSGGIFVRRKVNLVSYMRTGKAFLRFYIEETYPDRIRVPIDLDNVGNVHYEDGVLTITAPPYSVGIDVSSQRN